MGAGASTPAQTSSQAQLEVLTSIPEPVAPSLDEATAGHAAASAADEPSSTAPPPPSPPPKPLPPGRRPYAPVTMPSPEQMAQDDLMNNCAVRTGLSCVMGAGLGVAFGVFMGTMDAASMVRSVSRRSAMGQTTAFQSASVPRVCSDSATLVSAPDAPGSFRRGASPWLW